MQKKQIGDYSTEELVAQKKTGKAIIIIMVVLVVLYVGFFGYKMAAGTWERNNTFGLVMLAMLGVVIAINSSKITAINSELKKRT